MFSKKSASFLFRNEGKLRERSVFGGGARLTNQTPLVQHRRGTQQGVATAASVSERPI